MRRDNMTIIPQPFLSTVFLSGQYPPVARWKRLRNNDGTFLDWSFLRINNQGPDCTVRRSYHFIKVLFCR